MLLFGCDNDFGSDEIHQCGNTDANCRSWLAQYSLGVKGQICLPEEVGGRFGRDSFKYMLLQVHWNNNYLVNNITDNSGFRVYYTPYLRPYDLGNVQIGQNDLVIPANTAVTEQKGSCSGQCTNLIGHPLFLTRTYLHMHYLGSSGKVEIFRAGKLVRTVAEDVNYRYDLSPIHEHKPAIQVLPGDEIKVTCIYDSLNGEKLRNQTIYFGEGSEAEMCYAFISYYPKVSGFDQCVQFSEYDINCHGPEDSVISPCPWNSEYFIILKKTEIRKIIEVCQNSSCNSTCIEKFNKIVHKRKCRERSLLGPELQKVMIESQSETMMVSFNRLCQRCINENTLMSEY